MDTVSIAEHQEAFLRFTTLLLGSKIEELPLLPKHKKEHMKIICTIACTHSYQYALKDCIRRINAAVFHARSRYDIDFAMVISTDEAGVDLAKSLAPEAHIEITSHKESEARYKEKAQLLIADLQQMGFQKAIELGADLCWCVESDILVPYNALSCSLDMLQFDDGYYDVAFVTYPSHSGAMFLGGHGDPTHPIAEDFLPEERDIPEDLQAKLDLAESKMKSKEASEDDAKNFRDVLEEIKKCPPKGNIFELNAKNWRRRGWFDNAFPGVGRGAVLETDWTGLGCNLLSRRALSLASFDGYDGKGTQDLFLNWRRWKASDLRFCVISHCVCEHVVKKEDGSAWHAFAHHEPMGECRGHLRVQMKPYGDS